MPSDAPETWPIDPKYPKTEANRVPLYGVTWDRKSGRGRAGNAWVDVEEANRHFRAMEVEGRNPVRVVQFVADFAF